MGSMAFHIIRERKVALRKSYTCRGARADLSRPLPIRMQAELNGTEESCTSTF